MKEEGDKTIEGIKSRAEEEEEHLTRKGNHGARGGVEHLKGKKFIEVLPI